MNKPFLILILITVILLVTSCGGTTETTTTPTANTTTTTQTTTTAPTTTTLDPSLGAPTVAELTEQDFKGPEVPRITAERLRTRAENLLESHKKKAEIESVRNSLIEKRDRVKAMVKEGKSLDQVKEAFGVPLEQRFWRSLVEVIYLELTEGK